MTRTCPRVCAYCQGRSSCITFVGGRDLYFGLLVNWKTKVVVFESTKQEHLYVGPKFCARTPVCTSDATDADAGRNSTWPARKFCCTCVKGSPSPRIATTARIMTAFTWATVWTSHWCCSHRHASGLAARA